MKYYWREFIYSLIKHTLHLGFTFTYRNIITSGYKKVRKQKPAIFVANHQNTFMDGVVMVYTSEKSNPNILVRADIFKSKFAKTALSLLKLMPIYRKRDGLNTLSQNEQIFNQCFEIFSRQGVVALFPEGNHAFPRRLRTLQKGAARIAFQAEEENNFTLNLSLIPVGLQYENHTDRWHDVYVHYTDAIDLRQYESELKENPQKTYKTVTDEIQKGISSQMIDISWEEELIFFEQLRILMKEENKGKATEVESLVHQENKMINRLTNYFQSHEEEKESIKKSLNTYIKSLKKAGINTYFSLQKRSAFLLLLKSIFVILISPLYLLYRIVTAIPEYIIEKKVIAGVKDITWHLSLRYAVGAILYPIYFGIIWLILGLSINTILAAIVVYSLPILSVIGLEWQHHLKTLKNEWKLYSNKELIQMKSVLVKEINTKLG